MENRCIVSTSLNDGERERDALGQVCLIPSWREVLFDGFHAPAHGHSNVPSRCLYRVHHTHSTQSQPGKYTNSIKTIDVVVVVPWSSRTFFQVGDRHTASVHYRLSWFRALGGPSRLLTRVVAHIITLMEQEREWIHIYQRVVLQKCRQHISDVSITFAIDDVLNLNSTFDGYTFAAVILTFDIMMIPRYSVHKRGLLDVRAAFFFWKLHSILV